MKQTSSRSALLRRLLALVAVLALAPFGCKEKQDDSPLAGLAKGEGGGEAEPAEIDKADAEEAEPQREEPVATPARESLKLLADKGSRHVKSLRSERAQMYTLFNILEEEDKEEVKALLSDVEGLRWNQSPEALKAAPKKMADLYARLMTMATRFKKQGDEVMKEEVEPLVKENDKRKEEGKKPIRLVKIDKLQREGSYSLKVGRYLALIARSLLDEARIYAKMGSLAMREELRELFGPLKGEELPYEQVELAKQRLLYELNVEGVERPQD